MSAVCMEKPNVRCSDGSKSATKARKGSMVMLIEASIIISMPAPTNIDGAIETNIAELGINTKAMAVSIAPTRK